MCSGLNVTQSSSTCHSPTPVGVRHEKPSRGSNGAGAERLSRSIATSATTAARINATLANGDATIVAQDVAPMARPIKATRAAGTRGTELARADVDGRTKNAPSARQPAIAAVATKAARQLPKRAKIPPTNGPISTEALQLLDIKAITRGQSGSGKVARTST